MLINNFIHVFNFQMDSHCDPPATGGRGRAGSGGRSGRAASIPGQGRGSRSSTSSHSPGATDFRLDRRDSLAEVMQTDLPSTSHHVPGSTDPPIQVSPPHVHTP